MGWKNKGNSFFKKLSIEKHLPISLAIMTFILLVLCVHINIEKYLDNLISTTITFSSIIVGFVGVLLAVLFSLRATITVEALFRNRKQGELKRFFKRCIISGVLVVCISIVLYLRDMLNIHIVWNITVVGLIEAFWGATIVYLLVATYILLDIIMCIIFNDLPTEQVDSNKVSEDKKKDLQQRHSLKQQVER